MFVFNHKTNYIGMYKRNKLSRYFYFPYLINSILVLELDLFFPIYNLKSILSFTFFILLFSYFVSFSE